MKNSFLRLMIIAGAFVLTGYVYLEDNLEQHLLLGIFHDIQSQSSSPRLMAALENYRILKAQIDLEKQASRVEILKLNLPLFQRLRNSNDLKSQDYLYFQVFSDFNLAFKKQKIISHDNGLVTFVGEAESDPYSRAVLTFHERGIVGSFIVDGFEYKIKPLGEGLHLVARLNSKALNNIDPDYLEAPRPPPREVGKLSDTFNNGSFVDIMVVYSADAIAADPSIVATTTNIIAETNESLARSCINFRLRLVHTEQVVYAETLQSSQVLECLSEPADGCMDNVLTLRDTYGADIVSFWQANPIAIAYVAPLDQSNPVAGFNANSVYGIVDSAAFRHEFGHNIGIRHDRYSDDKSNYTYKASYRSGYAYVDIANNFSTNVARGASCYYADLGCQATGYYSNPRILRYGHPLGIPGIADAAAIANSQARYIADYRQALTDHSPDLSGCQMNSEPKKVTPQCFISTATYGSYLSPYTEKLRLFRDHVLNKSPFGRAFVKKYYELSPPFARAIDKSALLKVVAKIFLTPLIWFLVAPGVMLICFFLFCILAVFSLRLKRREL